MRRAMAITFWLLLPLSSVTQTAEESKLPRFEDFATTEKWTGLPAKVILDRPNVRMYRTQFRKASLNPPNFAGHYRVTTWGCGTDCIEGGMVDLATGKVAELPSALSSKDRASFWTLCVSAFAPSGIESRADSRLFIVRCADITGKEGGSYLHTSYFVFENESFKKIGEEIGKERVF